MFPLQINFGKQQCKAHLALKRLSVTLLFLLKTFVLIHHLFNETIFFYTDHSWNYCSFIFVWKAKCLQKQPSLMQTGCQHLSWLLDLDYHFPHGVERPKEAVFLAHPSVRKDGLGQILMSFWFTSVENGKCRVIASLWGFCKAANELLMCRLEDSESLYNPLPRYKLEFVYAACLMPQLTSVLI